MTGLGWQSFAAVVIVLALVAAGVVRWAFDVLADRERGGRLRRIVVTERQGRVSGARDGARSGASGQAMREQLQDLEPQPRVARQAELRSRGKAPRRKPGRNFALPPSSRSGFQSDN